MVWPQNSVRNFSNWLPQTAYRLAKFSARPRRKKCYFCKHKNAFRSQRVCQKLGLRVKMEIEYEKFLDNGQICFKDTNDGSTSARLLIGDLKQMGYC